MGATAGQCVVSPALRHIYIHHTPAFFMMRMLVMAAYDCVTDCLAMDLQAVAWSTFACRGSQDHMQVPQPEGAGCYRLHPGSARNFASLCRHPFTGALLSYRF